MRDDDNLLQSQFNTAIGQLDRALSLIMIWSRPPSFYELDSANKYTLKHHAEDMIGAGQKILERLEGKKEK